MGEQLVSLLPSLSGPQIEALLGVARAMLQSRPKEPRQYLTVTQIHEEYGPSKGAVYKAMGEGRLPYVTPNGQERPMYASREDVEAWLWRA